MSNAPDHSNEHDHIVPVRIYIIIFFTLMIGTAATVGAAHIDLGRWNIVLALLIACVKASLVVLFFMHIYYSSKFTKTILICGFCTLFIMFAFTGMDLAASGWFSQSTPWIGVPGR